MKSKRGVALAYVIVVTAALLVVATAIVALANYNLSVSQNSLEGRQAYLDARSAIEFGRAYLAEKPDSDNFYIIRSTSAGSGFAVSMNAAGAIATYDKEHGMINAKVPYSATHDRYRLLSYRICGGVVPSSSSGCSSSGSSGGSSASGSSGSGSSGGSSGSSSGSSGGSSSGSPSSGSSSSGSSSSGDSDNPQHDYLICGSGYGTTVSFTNAYYPTLVPNGTSDYPVVIKQMLVGTNNWNSSVSIHAPEIYLMDPSTSLTLYKEDLATFQSNFICIGGTTITGQDYRSTPSPTEHYTTLTLKTNPPGGTGILYFVKDCTLFIDGNAYKRSVSIPRGYYSFRDGMNLYDLTSSNFASQLKRMDESALPSFVSTSRINFIVNNYSSFLLGDNENHHEALWTDDTGGLANGLPSNRGAGLQYTLSSNTVFFYISSCVNWENSFSYDNIGPDVNTGIYSAKSIYMRYVNSTDDFVIPAGKTIVFRGNKIWMNTARNDTSPGGDVPITGASSGSLFLLQATSGSGPFELDVPAALTVNYTNLNGTAKSYRIKAGTYRLAQTINLLSDNALSTLNASYSG